MFATDKSCTIKRVDNGWVFEWTDPRDEDQHLTAWPQPKRPKERGSEVFTDAKKLTKRITDFIA